jgi:hypothetical protein
MFARRIASQAFFCKRLETQNPCDTLASTADRLGVNSRSAYSSVVSPSNHGNKVPNMSQLPATFRLLIDEVEIELGRIWIHSQDDPYPGGHRYRLWFPERHASVWRASGGELSGLSYVLSSIAREHQPKKDESPCFVLNTIQNVTQAEQGVEIVGEYSPHCSTLDCPYCGAMIWTNWLFDHCSPNADGSLQFTCKDCSKVATVNFSGPIVSLFTLDREMVSTCRQVALQHELREGVLTIRPGKLQWAFKG